VDTTQVVNLGLNVDTNSTSATLGFGGLLCLIEIWMKRDGGGTYLELQGLSIADADLVVGDMP
jgi:hypothetical protein